MTGPGAGADLLLGVLSLWGVREQKANFEGPLLTK